MKKIEAMQNVLTGDVKRLTNFTPEYRLRVQGGFKKRGNRSADSLVRANLTRCQGRADMAVRAPIPCAGRRPPPSELRLCVFASLRYLKAGESALVFRRDRITMNTTATRMTNTTARMNELSWCGANSCRSEVEFA